MALGHIRPPPHRQSCYVIMTDNHDFKSGVSSFFFLLLRRASVVEQTILRHVLPNWEGTTKSLNEKEEFVINKLGVPAKMIFSAKAMHMHNTNRFVPILLFCMALVEKSSFFLWFPEICVLI
jgi:hypothetical protein